MDSTQPSLPTSNPSPPPAGPSTTTLTAKQQRDLKKLSINANPAIMGDLTLVKEQRRSEGGETYRYKGAVYTRQGDEPEEWIEAEPGRFRKRKHLLVPSLSEKEAEGYTGPPTKKQQNGNEAGLPNLRVRHPRGPAKDFFDFSKFPPSSKKQPPVVNKVAKKRRRRSKQQQPSHDDNDDDLLPTGDIASPPSPPRAGETATLTPPSPPPAMNRTHRSPTQRRDPTPPIVQYDASNDHQPVRETIPYPSNAPSFLPRQLRPARARPHPNPPTTAAQPAAPKPRSAPKPRPATYNRLQYDYTMNGGHETKSCIEHAREEAAKRGLKLQPLPAQTLQQGRDYRTKEKMVDLVKVNEELATLYAQARELEAEFGDEAMGQKQDDNKTRQQAALQAKGVSDGRAEPWVFGGRFVGESWNMKDERDRWEEEFILEEFARGEVAVLDHGEDEAREE